ncbi:MAG TPA: DUF222 domain-containing protein [Methylomirabilota bacterium]|jgi:hypothetical protein
MLVQTTPNPEIEELDRLGDEIARLSAHLEVANARLLDLIREFDARGGWGVQGARSCAHWLAWRLGIELHAARERVRTARALGGLPKLRHALAHGELSYAKVRALTRVATPETEARLLSFGKAGTATHVERLVRGWRHVDRAAENRETIARQRNRTLQVYQADDGMVVIRGRLIPEVGAVLIQALNAARDRLYAKARGNDPAGDRPLHGQQQADALGMIAEAALAHDLDPGPSGDRYQVVLHVDAPVLADPDQPGQSVLEDGQHVPAGTSQRLACDASRVVMAHDAEGRTVEISARTRTVPPALRRALQHRDQGCRFPGCGLPFTQGHHIRHWAHGGPTTLSNLVLLCRRHHRSVHEDGFQMQRLASGELEFKRPNGWLIPEAPPLPAVPGDAVGDLRATNEAAGLQLDGRALSGAWSGERFSADYAISVMHPLAIRPSCRTGGQ